REPAEDRLRVAAAREVAHPAVRRVGGDECLGEEREPCPGRGALAGEPGELLDRRVAIQDHRLRLDARDLHRLVHGAPNPPPPGVSIVITSPTDTSVVTFAGSSLPFKRLRPAAPGTPPLVPCGARARRSAVIDRRQGSSASSSRTT